MAATSEDHPYRERPGRRVTIIDVADAAGVSPSAVSRVVRDAYGVSSNMRERVTRAIDELGYRPNFAARAMRGKTYTVGVIHPDIHNPFFPDIFDALSKLILPTGRQIFFASTEWSTVEDVLRSMRDRQVEAVAVFSPFIAETRLAEIARDLPLITMHRYGRSRYYDTVVSDDEDGALQVVAHLRDLGHTRITHIGRTQPAMTRLPKRARRSRAQAYRSAMQSLGLADRIDIGEITDFIFEEGYRVARDVLVRTIRPSAIFAGNDSVAFGVMQAAHELGIAIPGELSLVGYDNTSTAALAPISLTSVDQNPAAIGAAVGQLMLSRIDGRTKPEFHSFRPQLFVRSTTAPPA